MPLSHPKVAMIDLMYHDVDRTRGLYYKLQARDQLERTCTDDEIHEAMTDPPRPPGPACGVPSSSGPRSGGGTSPWTGSISS